MAQSPDDPQAEQALKLETLLYDLANIAEALHELLEAKKGHEASMQMFEDLIEAITNLGTQTHHLTQRMEKSENLSTQGKILDDLKSISSQLSRIEARQTALEKNQQTLFASLRLPYQAEGQS